MLSIKHFVCCDMDVHKKFVVATIARTDYHGVTTYEKKRFSDKNSAWIADLFKFDIVPGSYIACKEIQALRELFQCRQKLTGHRTSEKNRFQNALTVSNIALSSVLSDTFGKSATAIIDYILSAKTFDPEYRKSLLQKKAKKKADDVVKSIIGYELHSDQSVKMKACRKHIDDISECIKSFDEKISDLIKPYHKFIELATTIPGIAKKSAAYIIAETGVNISIFKSPKRLSSWAGVTPQNNESASKKRSVHISRAGVY